MSSTSTSLRSSSILAKAFAYSVPVLLGYITIGIAFGLFVSNTGYPIWLALFMSLWMYAGAGQFIAVGLFAAGTTLWEVCLIQLVVNARHIAYGLSMINWFPKKLAVKSYLIFSLTDETFALLSSLPLAEKEGLPSPGIERDRFMFYVSLLDQGYWVTGTLIGAAAGSFIPFNMDGIGFSLTALFVVLMMEQIFRILDTPGLSKEETRGKNRRAFPLSRLWVFVISAVAALVTVFIFPERIALLLGMVFALALSSILEFLSGKRKKGTQP